MARGKKHNFELAEYMCMELDNYVAQSNILVLSQQDLSIMSMKLIRLAIMQIKPEDKELRTFRITIKDLARTLEIDASNIYRTVDMLTDELLSNFIKITIGSAYKKANWVSNCTYLPDDGLYIRLNDELKPYLLNLKSHYTQYPLEAVIKMKSEYSIRFFELILEKVNQQILPINGLDIYLSLEEIKSVCGCNAETYQRFSNLKQKVIDRAIKEIHKYTLYRITYDKCNYLKQGKMVVGITFNMNMLYH